MRRAALSQTLHPLHGEALVTHEEIDYTHFSFVGPSAYIYKRPDWRIWTWVELRCGYHGHYCQRKRKFQAGRWVLCFLLGY